MRVPVHDVSSQAALWWFCCSVASALVVTSTLALSVGCSKSGQKSDSEINLVRNGFLKIRLGDARIKTYDSATVGKALERKFTNGTWRQFSTFEGVVVEFDAAVWPATLYRDGFSVWSAFVSKTSAASLGVPAEKGSLGLRPATTCINDDYKRVAIAKHGGRIVIDCRLLFKVQFTVSADSRNFDLRDISLATFDTDDRDRVLGYIYN